MEFRHLRYFAAVAKHLSFVKAAEELHMAQPPLSRQIAQLERELGARLFERGDKRTALTQSGEYLQVEVKRILDYTDAVCRSVRIIGEGESVRLKIGCAGFPLYTVLPPFFALVKRRFPQARLDVSVLTTEE